MSVLLAIVLSYERWRQITGASRQYEDALLGRRTGESLQRHISWPAECSSRKAAPLASPPCAGVQPCGNSHPFAPLSAPANGALERIVADQCGNPIQSIARLLVRCLQLLSIGLVAGQQIGSGIQLHRGDLSIRVHFLQHYGVRVLDAGFDRNPGLKQPQNQEREPGHRQKWRAVAKRQAWSEGSGRHLQNRRTCRLA